MSTSASAPGKIIISGEYAVVFGHPGIAVPAPLRVEVASRGARDQEVWSWGWEEEPRDPIKANTYVAHILEECKKFETKNSDSFLIRNTIPLGKGMGSSTALVIAIARCVLKNCTREAALAIENAVNPGNSGIDFAVIWDERPTLFKKGQAPQPIDFPPLKNFGLIDTGAPNEATPELVTWIMMKHVQNDPLIEPAIHTIGECTKRIVNGEDLKTVMRDHHRAQVKLGVVNEKTQKLITKIEQQGGAAKVIGAGGRTGGCGMVLTLDADFASIQTSDFQFTLLDE